MTNFSTQPPKKQPDIRETYERLDIDALDNAILNMSRLADEATMRGNEREAEKWQERVLVARDVWEDRIASVEKLALEPIKPEQPFGDWLLQKGENNRPFRYLKQEDGGVVETLYFVAEFEEKPQIKFNPSSWTELESNLRDDLHLLPEDIEAARLQWREYMAGGEQG